MIIEPIEPGEVEPFDVYRRLREGARDHWPVSKLANYLGVNTRTLRAQANAGHVPHPSSQARDGGLTLQLYNRDEALKVQDYYLRTGRHIKRRIDPNKPLGEQQW